MTKLLIFVGLLFATTMVVGAQPRPAEQPTGPSAPKKIAPATFIAKYEGGLFGFTEKEEGTLKFDELNNRLVFTGKDQKERFGIPYHSVLMIYPETKSVQPTAGAIISHIPYAGLAGLIREKRRYLIMHFDDPDIESARGVINFKLDNKDLLDAVIQTLGEKAKLTQRGDAYYRPRKVATEL